MRYAYEALDSVGQPVKGELDASSKEEGIAKIRAMGRFPTLIKEERENYFEIPVQIDGKEITKIEVPVSASADEAYELARKCDEVAFVLQDREVTKYVAIPKKLVNIITKPEPQSQHPALVEEDMAIFKAINGILAATTSNSVNPESVANIDFSKLAARLQSDDIVDADGKPVDVFAAAKNVQKGILKTIRRQIILTAGFMLCAGMAIGMGLGALVGTYAWIVCLVAPLVLLGYGIATKKA